MALKDHQIYLMIFNGTSIFLQSMTLRDVLDHLEIHTGLAQGGFAGNNVGRRFAQQLFLDGIPGDIGINLRDLADHIEIPFEHSVILHVCEMQGAADGGQTGGLIHKGIFADQVAVDGHDAISIFQCAFRHAFAIGVRQDGHGWGAFLNQHIQMLAQAVRPPPRLTVQVAVGYNQIRLAGFHEVE